MNVRSVVSEIVQGCRERILIRQERESELTLPQLANMMFRSDAGTFLSQGRRVFGKSYQVLMAIIKGRTKPFQGRRWPSPTSKLKTIISRIRSVASYWSPGKCTWLQGWAVGFRAYKMARRATALLFL